MTIVDVRASAVRVPLRRPVRFSTRTVSSRDYVIVSMTADDGLRGTGFAYAGTSGGEVMGRYVDDVLAPAILESSDSAPNTLWPRLYQDALLLGRGGLGMRALAAVDIAAWDLLATRSNAPLYRVLGLGGDHVAAYASGGYYGDGDPVDAVRQEFASYSKLGFRDYKIKVGGRSGDVDVARVAAARECLGSGGRLALDANNAWANAWDALGFLRRVEQYDIRWIEEPLPPDDFAGHAELSRRTNVPVATGELLASRYEARQLHEARAASVWQLDAGVMGGITEWLRVAGLARTAGYVLAPHWHANLHAQLVDSPSSGEVVEYFGADTDIFNFEQILTPESRLEVIGGNITRPAAAGVGVTFDPAALDEFAVR